MKIFPTQTKYFRLLDSQRETLDRLQRRTEKSEKLVSKFTDKSFIGTINGNNFKLISSQLGKGAFCVLKGEIKSDEGFVYVEIHKTFRTLITIMIALIPVGLAITYFTKMEKFDPMLILVFILQIVLIRYVAIELSFRFLSRNSLQRLRDVLDIDWIDQK